MLDFTNFHNLNYSNAFANARRTQINTTKMKLVINFIVLCFLCSNFLSAQINTDRPNQTDSSSTLPEGSFQIESGFQVGFNTIGATTARQILLPINLFRVSLSEKLELRLINQLQLNKRGEEKIQGIGDIELGAKFQLYKKETSPLEVAILSHLVVPTGNFSLSNRQIGNLTKIAVSHPVTKNLGLSYNLGFSSIDSGDMDLSYSVSLGYSLNQKMSLFIEPYGRFDDFEDVEFNVDAGFVYLIKDHIQLDLVFGSGMNYDNNFLSVGCSWLFLRNTNTQVE